MKPPKVGSPKLENERKPVERLKKLEDSWVRRKVEALNNVKQEKKETVNARKLEKAADEENTKSLAESAQKPKNPATEKCPVQSRQKSPAEDKQQNCSQEKRELRKGQCENLDQEAKDLKVGEDDVFNQKQKALDVQKSPGLVTLRNDGPTKPPQRASWERRSVSRLEVKIHSRVRNSSEAAPVTSASGPRVRCGSWHFRVRKLKTWGGERCSVVLDIDANWRWCEETTNGFQRWQVCTGESAVLPGLNAK